jgi:hypothetical protein
MSDSEQKIYEELRAIADKYQIKFIFTGTKYVAKVNDFDISVTSDESNKFNSDSVIRMIEAVGEKPKIVVYKHRKRGTEYSVLGEGMLQVENDEKLEDYSSVVIYKGDDGQLWVRSRDKFHDGRFEKIVRESQK